MLDYSCKNKRGSKIQAWTLLRVKYKQVKRVVFLEFVRD